MKKFKIILFLVAILMVQTACDNSIKNREEILQKLKPTSHASVPLDFVKEKWNELPFPYCFVIRTVETTIGTRTLFIIGNKEENSITETIELDPFLLICLKSTQQKNTRTAVVKFPEDSSELEKTELDISPVNLCFQKMKELKDFSWSNEKQNRIVSQILAATQLRGINSTNDNVTEELMGKVQLSNQEQLNKIYASDYAFNVRALIRYQSDIDFGQLANSLGFRSQMETSKIYSTGEKKHINYFVNDSILSLKNPKDLITYSPIISFDKDGNFFPIVKFMVFSYILNQEKFPVFSKKVIFLSIFDGKIVSLKYPNPQSLR